MSQDRRTATYPTPALANGASSRTDLPVVVARTATPGKVVLTSTVGKSLTTDPALANNAQRTTTVVT